MSHRTLQTTYTTQRPIVLFTTDFLQHTGEMLDVLLKIVKSSDCKTKRIYLLGMHFSVTNEMSTHLSIFLIFVN